MIKTFPQYKNLLSSIRQEVYSNRELFNQFTLRQEYDGTCHTDTKCIFLRGPKGVDKNTKTINEYACFHSLEFDDWDNRSLFPSVDVLLDQLANHYREIGWITVVSLKPKGFIAPHADEGEYCKKFTRYHYPVETHNSMFIVSDEVYRPIDGELFTYDNQQIHTAYNPSDNERIHLIFDAH